MNKVALLFIKWIRLSLCLITLSFYVLSCEKDEIEPVENQKTLFMYLPWSTNLTSNFYTNISDMEKAISQKGLNGERVIVFMSTTSEKATLFEITCKKGKCEQVTLKEYNNPPFTTAEGITSILNDVKSFAPAPTYAMTIGCHGMGWLPVHSTKGRARTSIRMHWENEGVPQTRYFGGTTSQYQTDITTLAEGIAILFARPGVMSDSWIITGMWFFFAPSTTGTATKPPLENTKSGFNFFNRRFASLMPFSTLNTSLRFSLER